MKTKLLLLILFSIFFLNARAQTSVYHPFPMNYGSWSYEYYDEFGMPSHFITQTLMLGDTMISGITYKKIHSPSGFGGAIRELNRILYYYPDSGSHEYVLYNFNLNLGDTIVDPYGGAVCTNDTVIVTKTDSILCTDGYHRTLGFNSFAIWIEGVGSINYLLEPFNVYCVSGNDVLECLVGDSGMIYHNPQDPNSQTACISSTNDKSDDKFAIFISPNPLVYSSTLHLNTPLTTAEAIIYNILGKEMLRKSFSGNEVQIEKGKMESGVYFVKVHPVEYLSNGVKAGEKEFVQKLIVE